MSDCPIDIRVLEALELHQIVPIAGGMSGARVYQCLHKSGMPLILRVWPAEMTEPRLSEITRLVVLAKSHLSSLIPAVFPLNRTSLRDHLQLCASTEQHDAAIEQDAPSKRAKDEGFGETPWLIRTGDSVPSNVASEITRPATRADFGLGAQGEPLWSHCKAGYWQLVEQIPGRPLAFDSTGEQILAGVDSIRRVHTAFSAFGERSEMPFAIRSRLRRLDQVHDRLGDTISPEPAPERGHLLASAVSEAASIWNRYAKRMKHRIFDQLTKDSQAPQVVQYVLRDIHRENLFFEGRAASGFFDFDSIRVDTPWVDLSRWMGSFGSGDLQTERWWETAVVRFINGHPTLQEVDVQRGALFARRLHEATSWISLANWLVWLCRENRAFSAPPDVLAGRIRRLNRLVSECF